MKRYPLWLVLAQALLALPLYGEERVYVLRKGDTLYSVAQTYGVQVQALLDLNGIDDPRKVRAGQRIQIPGAAAAGEEKKTPAVHKVVWGDTLSTLARKYQVPVAELRKANGLAEGDILKEGQTLKIPVRQPAVSPRPAKSGEVDPAISWPVKARELAYMTGKLHGVVLLGETAEPVKSLTGGTVVAAGPYRGFGRVAIVQAPDGYLYVYGGCASLSVKEGEAVNPGAELGRLGIDGVSEKPQLFFLVYQNNKPVDPAKAPRA